MPHTRPLPRVIAGAPSHNLTLYHQTRFQCGDPSALVLFPDQRGKTLIIRDIEADRARAQTDAARVLVPADLTPAGGLAAERETATAQALAELLIREDETTVLADRTFPLVYAEALRERGVAIEYDPEMGVRERRAKDEQEIRWLREAQRATESAMELACTTIARATPNAEGVLQHEGADLTSDRVRTMIDIHLLRMGYTNGLCIVACGAEGGDCHNRGEGPIRTGTSVIVDIFPQNRETLYNGDCTRTVVHGEVPDDLRRAHEAVVRAKAAATTGVNASVTADSVHQATIASLKKDGYRVCAPVDVTSETEFAMVHGTGHGIGLEVHEQPLIDRGGPALVEGDALTIEPGLYARAIGGVRVEDMVIVTPEGCENLNTLHEGLDWA
ncbi:MAG: M24 family metallopeptidase [Phycisphaerales bacterium JB059]